MDSNDEACGRYHVFTKRKKKLEKKNQSPNKKNADSPGELANFCFERGIAEFGKMIENGGLFGDWGIKTLNYVC